MEGPTLVLCIDRDNDLYEKAGVSAPVIGRKNNLDAATKLALADPEDPDSNTIFYAIKLYDEMKKEKRDAVLVTLAGNKSLGYSADKEISEQLETVIAQTRATSCVFISDGASDEEIIPIIRSRIKIDSKKIIFIKQAKELEKTYFVILEKMRDPYYAKILIGVPAALILLFSLSSYFNLGWQPVGIILGLYLLIKGFGFDEFISRFFRSFSFSFGKSSWVAYLSSVIFFVVGIVMLVQGYFYASQTFGGEKLFAYLIRNSVYVFLFSFLLAVVGKSLDEIQEGKRYSVTKNAFSAIGFILTALVLKVGSDWILNMEPPYVSFGDFLLTVLVSVAIGYISYVVIKMLQTDMLLGLKLEGKEIINEHGTYIGKVLGLDPSGHTLIVQTAFDKKVEVSFNSVLSASDRVVIASKSY